MTNPLLEKLGYGPEDRLVILHADDVGMCHGSNVAYLDLLPTGNVRTGSVMVPCPWSPETLQMAAADPRLDLGVHLTLTSEWSNYRWGPISTRDAASGLLDDEGLLLSPVSQASATVWMSTRPRSRCDAQIERVKAAGVDFTHLDGHMGAPMVPELREFYVQLGFEYQVPVLLLRSFSDHKRVMGFGDPMQQEELTRTVASLEAKGMFFPDWFRITPIYGGATGEPSAEVYEDVLRNLSPGVTYFALHPNAPGDIEMIGPAVASWRTFEHAYFQSERAREFLAEQQITPIGYREIRDAMRQG